MKENEKNRQINEFHQRTFEIIKEEEKTRSFCLVSSYRPFRIIYFNARTLIPTNELTHLSVQDPFGWIFIVNIN